MALKKRTSKFNSKRKMLRLEDCDFDSLSKLAAKACYGGNPEHKRNPGDFNLTPPSTPRPGKSLCDVVQVFTRTEALALLRKGLANGLISDLFIGQWPKNVWSVTNTGIPLEAQLESSETGSYHGYPIPQADPFYDEVIRQWPLRSQCAMEWSNRSS